MPTGSEIARLSGKTGSDRPTVKSALGLRGPMTITGTWRRRFPRAVPASSRIPNDPTAIFNRPHDYDGPFCQQRCALGPCLTQITLHCFYRRLVLGHPD